MGNSKDCINLDLTRKAKIKIDLNGKVLYVNNYFSEVTGFKIHEIILKELEDLLHSDMPKMAKRKVLSLGKENRVSYFIFKGKTADNNCYWSFVKMTQEFNEYSELKGYLLEIKMLPIGTIEKIDKLYDILREIENNAGIDAADKYLEGYLEEKNYSFNDFILALTEVDAKKIEKYFEIDEDAQPKKKKKGWF
jgi:PAS domain S-box-containing protein